MTAAGRSAFFFPKTVDASSIRAIIHYKLKLRSNEVSKVTIKEMIELIDADLRPYKARKFQRDLELSFLFDQ